MPRAPSIAPRKSPMPQPPPETTTSGRSGPDPARGARHRVLAGSEWAKPSGGLADLAGAPSLIAEIYPSDSG